MAGVFPNFALEGRKFGKVRCFPKVLGIREQDKVYAEPYSIVGTTLWGWKNNSFSRSDNLAIFTADRELDVKIAGDPDRIPTRSDTIEAELLGL